MDEGAGNEEDKFDQIDEEEAQKLLLKNRSNNKRTLGDLQL